jgi:hypothetical protein
MERIEQGGTVENNVGTKQEALVCKKVRKHADKLRHSDRHAARQAVALAINDGYLTRPSHCSKCGQGGKIQAHHHSYELIHWLDVEWLCTSCHGLHHRGRRKEPTKQIGLRFTPSEYTTLSEKARKAGMPLATLIRAAAIFFLVEKNVKIN